LTSQFSEPVYELSLFTNWKFSHGSAGSAVSSALHRHMSMAPCSSTTCNPHSA